MFPSSEGRDPIWDIVRHTQAKHAILERYLQAWFPVLARYHDDLLYVDGFAGPGEYAGGIDGSPVIALRAAMAHRERLSNARLQFVFIERDRDSLQHLERRVRALDLPSAWSAHCVLGTFADHMETLTPELRRARGRPAFIMIDPFGWAGVPFTLVQELAPLPRLEVLVSFMAESINRFFSVPTQTRNFDALFGCPDWRDCPTTASPEQRWRFFHDLYRGQLRTAGFQYPRSFEMRDNGNRIEYFLMHGTHSIEGLRHMKSAMWRADPSGTFQFRDTTDPAQGVLLGLQPDFRLLGDLLAQRFTDAEATVAEVERFVLVETPFLDTHYKRVLRTMENSGSLAVIGAKESRRRGTFPSGTRVRFIR